MDYEQEVYNDAQRQIPKRVANCNRGRRKLNTLALILFAYAMCFFVLSLVFLFLILSGHGQLIDFIVGTVVIWMCIVTYVAGVVSCK